MPRRAIRRAPSGTPDFYLSIETRDPLTTDNDALGYRIGSRWINTATNREFVLTSITLGTALWVSVTQDPAFFMFENDVGSRTVALPGAPATDVIFPMPNPVGAQASFTGGAGGTAEYTGALPTTLLVIASGILFNPAGAPQTNVTAIALNGARIGAGKASTLGAGGSGYESLQAIVTVANGDLVSLVTNSTLAAPDSITFLSGSLTGYGMQPPA